VGSFFGVKKSLIAAPIPQAPTRAVATAVEASSIILSIVGTTVGASIGLSPPHHRGFCHPGTGICLLKGSFANTGLSNLLNHQSNSQSLCLGSVLGPDVPVQFLAKIVSRCIVPEAHKNMLLKNGPDLPNGLEVSPPRIGGI
jgi:hypothetical protein